jgi:ubiquinone/menaquinone biosynthesis C-methylase UbiE
MHEHGYVPAAGKDWLLPFYDPFHRLLGAERLHRRLLEQAAIVPGVRILEIGCGTGNLCLLAGRLHPQVELSGIDPDPKALERARRKAVRWGVRVEFRQAFAERLPFADASFDIVLSSLMLHHLSRDTKVPALREARRVLKPGAALHLVDFGGPGHAGGLHAFLARLVHGHRGESRPDDVLGLMHEAGFASARERGSDSRILGRIVYYHAVAPTSSPTAYS